MNHQFMWSSKPLPSGDRKEWLAVESYEEKVGDGGLCGKGNRQVEEDENEKGRWMRWKRTGQVDVWKQGMHGVGGVDRLGPHVYCCWLSDCPGSVSGGGSSGQAVRRWGGGGGSVSFHTCCYNTAHTHTFLHRHYTHLSLPLQTLSSWLYTYFPHSLTSLQHYKLYLHDSATAITKLFPLSPLHKVSASLVDILSTMKNNWHK